MIININMIAERRARKVREMTVLRVASMVVLLVILAMVTLNIAAWTDHYATMRNLDEVNNELKDLNVKKQQLDAIQRDIDADRPVLTLIEQVRVSEGAWMTILADLSMVTPADVTVMTLNSTANKDNVVLRVSGRARDQATVGTFMESLNERTEWALLPTLGNVTTENNRQTGSSIVRFDLTIPVQGMIGGKF